MNGIVAALLRLLTQWKSRHALELPVSGSHGSVMHAASRFPAGKRFLHVGCGRARKPNVAPVFLTDEWQEIRLDIDPVVEPDVVASMLDMSVVPDASMDAVYSSHNIEHLYPHEVAQALSEFRRVLDQQGVLLLTCPDLQSLGQLIADDRLDQPIYVSAAGPIAPIDVLFGHRPQLAAGNLFMAHRTGFTLRTLVDAVRAAGFRTVVGRRVESRLEIRVAATKELLPDAAIQELADRYLPE